MLVLASCISICSALSVALVTIMSTLVHSHIHTHSPHTLSPHTYFPLTDIPSQLRLQALQLVMLLMPDENREALLSLLTFLKEVAEHADTNQVIQSTPESNSFLVRYSMGTASPSTLLERTGINTSRKCLAETPSRLWLVYSCLG